jgi:capsule biosynthesis phosphatase
MNIFILCAGKGTRFESIYPKPLNLINGKPMIYHTIKSLNLEKVKDYNLYIIYNKKLENCNFKQILINMFPCIKFNFILIDYYTRGASESAYIGIQSIYNQINNKNIIFIDNDTIYPEETYEYLNKNYESNFIFTNYNNEKEHIYSYVSINKDNYIIDIKEKEKISDIICIGCYGFKNKDEFINIFKNILQENEKTRNEFYMSLIYKFIIQNNKQIQNITINKTISLGTPQQLIDKKLQIDKKLRYVFDLDNTLVTYPEVHGDYTTVKPIIKMINLLKKLKNDNHTIIIYTARRMGSHGHNIGSVIKDIGKITFDTLDKFEIPYDELIFGKPLGDVYIDDRSYNPYDERIFKLLGEYQLIDDDIENKIENNKYNQIKSIDEKILKNINKDIGKGELFFYENLNLLKENKKYFPEYFGYKINNDIQLKIEKINSIPISYLYINNTYSIKLFKNLLEILKNIHSIKLDNILDINEYKNNYFIKLNKRFEDKNIYNFNNAEQIYDIMIERLNEYYLRIPNNIVSVIHGDFWFSNILISYNDEYKFIDMKGIINNNLSISGDKVYDYAKILQSIIGFDSILYDKEINNEYNNIFINFYKEWLNENEPTILFEDIKTITAILIFGVFHAYNNMSTIKKEKIIGLVKNLLSFTS